MSQHQHKPADEASAEEEHPIKAELQKNASSDSLSENNNGNATTASSSAVASGNNSAKNNDASSSPASDNNATSEKQFVEIKVPKAILKYDLKPQVISDANIVFYNAQVKAYYQRTLKNPDLYVWLLCDNLEPNYTAKRIFETAWKNNIQVKIVEASKFDLIVSQGTYIMFDALCANTQAL